ncbi:hypothetical protein Mpsy_1526 [Methanolobus psychrophilus R15]|nr:hypothetical protein Mpsy_1526 [Methanolobus psychrophilus R15]
MKRLGDSAQLLLIAGFAIGVGIVIITVMLNNVIYASNMASESSIDTSRYDIANAIQTTTEAYQDAYRYSMNNGTNGDYDNYIDSYSKKASQNYATAGFTFHLQNHNFSDPYFTNNGLAGGKDNWTLVSNVNSTEVFLIDIPNTSIMGNESNPLVIEAVKSGMSLWSIEMYNSSGKVNITITDGSLTSNTKSIIDTVVNLNITGNKINAEMVSFNFSASTSGHDYSINIYNGSTTVGIYTISGNLTSGQPFTLIRHKVANPTLRMASSRMSINRTIPVSLPGGGL